MTDDTPRPGELYWLSFADPTLPSGNQFLGVVVMRARSFGAAIENAWRYGVNPGGEVMGSVIPAEYESVVPKTSRGRLLSRAESEALLSMLDSAPHS
ncbi:hypothetical protein [Paraburkholderia sp. MM6662-R1]|uniref:hypothetical protein n=1 Tax=Paraburkholderia sp. MM6662-R1 TaxID=2991066 RepID=UPI003D196E71